jgi:hypothetical protein
MYTFTVDWMINCTPRTPESFLYYEKHANYKREGQILHARCDNRANMFYTPLAEPSNVPKLLN